MAFNTEPFDSAGMVHVLPVEQSDQYVDIE